MLLSQIRLGGSKLPALACDPVFRIIEMCRLLQQGISAGLPAINQTSQGIILVVYSLLGQIVKHFSYISFEFKILFTFKRCSPA